MSKIDLQDQYSGTNVEELLELCGDCDVQYCFFREVLHAIGGANVRQKFEQYDSRLCAHLEAVIFRTPLTYEQLVRRKLYHELRFKLGVEFARNPEENELNDKWAGEYEPKFRKAYSDGVRGLQELRAEVFG